MNLPTIRVSDEVDQEIRRQGGFGDTHDTVLRRVLGLDKKGASPTGNKRAPHGSVTGTKAYRPIILKALLTARNKAMHAAAVLDEVDKQMRGSFTPYDTEATSSGAVRWQNKTQWAREELVQEGMLEPVAVAGRGVWKLTAKGVTEAQKL